ncbi:uncharacterized protein LOC142990362 [Genypterus blacodes]|uniref:uncharacterized protein LOC142990362 n=1 Tax=Genypterus blacodes TaxID=154954 RepID=UPI003F765A0F
MSKFQTLRLQVSERLSAAVEEILDLFERTMDQYEQERARTQQNHPIHKAPREELHPEVHSHSADTQQLLVEWSSSLDQEEPESTHVKEEHQEPWSSQEGEQLQGPEETKITKFTLSLVTVKSEEDEADVQLSQFHQSQTEENTEAELLCSSSTDQTKPEADGEEDWGGPGSTRTFCPGSSLQPVSEDKALDLSGPESEYSEDDRKETRRPLRHDVSVGDVSWNEDSKSFSRSRFGATFNHKGNRTKRVRTHAGERPFRCSVCGNNFQQHSGLKKHMRSHAGDKPFSCIFCGKHFFRNDHLKVHMRIHTGEKPYSCSFCGYKCIQSENLKRHMMSHTGQKPFSCSECGKSFTRKESLKSHTSVHSQGNAQLSA